MAVCRIYADNTVVSEHDSPYYDECITHQIPDDFDEVALGELPGVLRGHILEERRNNNEKINDARTT